MARLIATNATRLSALVHHCDLLEILSQKLEIASHEFLEVGI
jgi:hypothetical protein